MAAICITSSATLLLARCSMATAFLQRSLIAIPQKRWRPGIAEQRSYKDSPFISTRLFFSTKNTTAANDTDQESRPAGTASNKDDELEPLTPPWSLDLLSQKKQKKSNNVVRVRQHVNPLARRFQMQTILSDDWPTDVFHDCSKSKKLFLDIGAAKGGFLLQLASQRPHDYNYLGLEIRPLAVQFAQDRLKNNPNYSGPCTGHLNFVGCNANVDLQRLLTLYRDASTSDASSTPLEMVTIQFPDPHFKKGHAKRKVVTPELVNTLPAFMPPGAKVFLQSDVQAVLDDMRERFREASLYFEDQVQDVKEYYPENVIGVPTEREISVLEQDLPVYRALFVRTNVPFALPSSEEQ